MDCIRSKTDPILDLYFQYLPKYPAYYCNARFPTAYQENATYFVIFYLVAFAEKPDITQLTNLNIRPIPGIIWRSVLFLLDIISKKPYHIGFSFFFLCKYLAKKIPDMKHGLRYLKTLELPLVRLFYQFFNIFKS